MDRLGAPPESWLLVLQYVSYILNRLSNENLNYLTPIQVATGQRPDISAILRFHFWEPVYFYLDEDEELQFPSKSPKKLGRFVGFAENIGNVMCCKILTEDTEELIPRSRVESAAKDVQTTPVKSEGQDIEMGNQTPDFIKSFSEDQKQKLKDLFGTGNHDDIDPSDLVGKSYLQPDHNKDGTRY